MKKTMPNRITIRLSDELYQRIKTDAREARISPVEYVRQMLTKGRVTIRQEIIAEVPELKKVIAELGKIGSNLNQIARYYNSGGASSSYLYDRIMQALGDLFDMKYEIEKLGGEFRGYSQARRHPKQ